MADSETDIRKQKGPIAFGQRLAGSQAFKALFDDGIALIEETAAYLDDEGRAASKVLGSNAKLTYATLSMKLTTRLMSLASWLLVQRAVNEGEMTAENGRDEHDKVKLGSPLDAPAGVEEMPAGLIELFGRCADLQHRIMRLDTVMREDPNAETSAEIASNAVADHMKRLQSAFN